MMQDVQMRTFGKRLVLWRLMRIISPGGVDGVGRIDEQKKLWRR